MAEQGNLKTKKNSLKIVRVSGEKLDMVKYPATNTSFS